MTSPLSYLLSLDSVAKSNGHRFLVRLIGSRQWQQVLLTNYLAYLKKTVVFKLGGGALTGAEQLDYKHGQRLLGRELDCIIYDDEDGFDANSLTAVSGSLRSGGLFFLSLSNKDSLFYQWLENSMASAIVIRQNFPLPELPRLFFFEQHDITFSEQVNAILRVKKVFSGHAKRPLILTADRGRGKSSALGIAAAQLINQENVRVLITAPSRKSVEPAFYHVEKNLRLVSEKSRNAIFSNESFFKFVSPDELLRHPVDCDLLLVDEASAIPLSMLEAMALQYNRTVFSSTIHGYEGCGRGFTLKFFKWLDQARPDWKKYHIQQPIRWNVGDPLEAWIFDTFLLNSDISSDIDMLSNQDPHFMLIEKQTLIETPNLFRRCFSLLVNAHYQTSPNDLLQILDDDTVNLFIQVEQGKLVGCIVAKTEGELDSSLIKAVAFGKRRPRGHFSPVILSGQLGFDEAAKCRSLRVMRIAVSPYCQRNGVGTQMLSMLEKQETVSFDYISTSFGVTDNLYRFWIKNDYVPMRLGSRLDQASGTHSMLMVKLNSHNSWFDEASRRFSQDFIAGLPETFRDLPADLVLLLLKSSISPNFQVVTSKQIQLIKSYVSGGSCYENIVYSVSQLLLMNIVEEKIQPILISKLLQKKTWKEIVEIYSLSGKKQAEQMFRRAIDMMCQFTV